MPLRPLFLSILNVDKNKTFLQKTFGDLYGIDMAMIAPKMEKKCQQKAKAQAELKRLSTAMWSV